MYDTHKFICVPVDWDWHVGDRGEEEVLEETIMRMEYMIDEVKGN